MKGGSYIKSSQPRGSMPSCKYSGTPANGGTSYPSGLSSAGKSTKKIVKSTSAPGIGPDSAGL